MAQGEASFGPLKVYKYMFTSYWQLQNWNYLIWGICERERGCKCFGTVYLTSYSFSLVSYKLFISSLRFSSWQPNLDLNTLEKVFHTHIYFDTGTKYIRVNPLIQLWAKVMSDNFKTLHIKLNAERFEILVLSITLNYS